MSDSERGKIMSLRTFLSYVVLYTLTFTVQAAAISETRPAPAGVHEGIVLDVQTGNYVITYEAEDELRPKGFYQTIFTPATKIDPSLKSRYHYHYSDKIIAYTYKIKNGPNAVQNIDNIDFIVNNMNDEMESPKHWKGLKVTNFDGPGFRAGWHYSGNDDLGGIAPRAKLSGFELKSEDLPGIGFMRLQGATPILGFAGDGLNEEMEEQLQNLEKGAVNSIPRPATIPLIPVPNPFDAAAVLTSMQKHVNQDLVSMKLIDPTFASQLNRLFQAAIAAAKGDNTVALKGNLKDLRQMLKREYADVDHDNEDGDKDDDDKNKGKDKPRLIDKLAAKVLNFDFKYIQKRLGKDS